MFIESSEIKWETPRAAASELFGFNELLSWNIMESFELSKSHLWQFSMTLSKISRVWAVLAVRFVGLYTIWGLGFVGVAWLQLFRGKLLCEDGCCPGFRAMAVVVGPSVCGWVVGFFCGAYPLGQRDLVRNPLFPDAPLAGCRRYGGRAPCPWGQPIGFCQIDGWQQDQWANVLAGDHGKAMLSAPVLEGGQYMAVLGQESPERGGPFCDHWKARCHRAVLTWLPLKPCGWYKEPYHES